MLVAVDRRRHSSGDQNVDRPVRPRCRSLSRGASLQTVARSDRHLPLPVDAIHQFSADTMRMTLPAYVREHSLRKLVDEDRAEAKEEEETDRVGDHGQEDPRKRPPGPAPGDAAPGASPPPSRPATIMFPISAAPTTRPQVQFSLPTHATRPTTRPIARPLDEADRRSPSRGSSWRPGNSISPTAIPRTTIVIV